MFPLLFLGGLLAFLFWYPSHQASSIGAIPNEDVYPVQGDIVTLAFPCDGPLTYPRLARSSQEIIDVFASRGYQLLAASPGGPPIQGVCFRKFAVVKAAANIAVPRQLGQGLVIYAVRRGS